MGRKVKWGLLAVVFIATGVLLAFLFSGVGLRKKYDALSNQAAALQMLLEVPPTENNPEAERYRREVEAFSKGLGAEVDGISFYSENPETVSFAQKSIRRILPTVYALSECESYGRLGDDDLKLESWTAISYLYTDGSAALIRGDFRSMIKAARAIRQLTEIESSLDTISAGTTSIFSRLYACLLQRGAESAANLDDLELIAKEASNWKTRSYRQVARNSIVEEFERIEGDVLPAPGTASPLDRANEFLWGTEPGKLKRKIFALEAGIKLLSVWEDDKQIWKLTAGRQSSRIEYFMGFVKEREFELRRSSASLAATLHARRAQLRGRPWPTIDELTALGVETCDPVFGRAYIWKDFEGSRRLFGSIDPRDPKINGFLLLSDDEMQPSP